jgi:SAM-dependent methyltransferase
MSATSQPPASPGERVRRHFRATASSFDRLYDEEGRFQRFVRPALAERADLAVEVVRSLSRPSVLDVGCGSGRVGERVLDAGAARYVGIDFSEEMLALARARLVRFGEQAELVEGDFLTEPLEGPFDAVLALGLFDYTPEPERFAQRMSELSSGAVVASFPRWTWLKGPIRKVRYEKLNDCPIFDYDAAGVERLFRDAGFSTVELRPSGRSGLLAVART